MTVRLGISPACWSNADDQPGPGGGVPLERRLREARAAGYSGVEMGAGFPNEPEGLRPLLDDHGLRLVSGWFPGGLLELGNVEGEKRRLGPQLDLFLALGCPVMAYAETTGAVHERPSVPAADRPQLRRDDARRYGEGLSKLADWLKAEGCPMAFHHHPATVFAAEAEVDLLMEATDPASIGLLLDTGDLAFTGGDVPGTLRRHAARVRHVHAKNVRPDVLERARERRWSFPKAVAEGAFTVPGDPEGGVDFRQVCKVLKEIDYQGWIVVEAEQDLGKADPVETMQIAREGLAAACREADLPLA